MSNRTEFGSRLYNITLYKKFKFELFSFLKRLFNNKIILTNKKYIQLGCGPADARENFINLDFYSNREKNVLFSDFRYPLRFNNNLFFGAFSEHTLEHLNSFDSIKFLSEVHRILVEGGIFRIVVPDLDRYVGYYNKKKSNAFFEKNFRNGCEAIWSLTQNWGHFSVWNYKMLKFQLTKVGFSKVYKKKFKYGIKPELLIDKDGRQVESLYVEAVK